MNLTSEWDADGTANGLWDVPTFWSLRGGSGVGGEVVRTTGRLIGTATGVTGGGAFTTNWGNLAGKILEACE